VTCEPGGLLTTQQQKDAIPPRKFSCSFVVSPRTPGYLDRVQNFLKWHFKHTPRLVTYSQVSRTE
jgi:hypothetical protein